MKKVMFLSIDGVLLRLYSKDFFLRDMGHLMYVSGLDVNMFTVSC